MSDIALLIDRWRDDELPAEEQRALTARLAGDAVLKREFIADALLQGGLATLLRQPTPEQAWTRVAEALHSASSTSGAQRVLAAVERGIDQRPSQRYRANKKGRSSARLRVARRPTAWWPWATLAAACLVVAVLVATHQTPPAGEAPLAVLHGTAVIERGTSTIAGHDGLALSAADRVTATTSVELALRDGSRVALVGVLTIHDLSLLRLHDGRVEVAAAKRAPDQALSIATAQATVTVVGTRFSVASTDGRTRLTVEEGIVRFAPLGGEARLVHAGERAEAPLAAPVAAPTPTPPARGVTAFQFVVAATGVPLPAHARVTGDTTLRQADLRRVPIGVLALSEPADVGPLGFSVDGQEITPRQGKPPYSLTASRSLAGDVQLVPWNPGVGRHVLTATPADANAKPLTITITVTGDSP